MPTTRFQLHSKKSTDSRKIATREIVTQSRAWMRKWEWRGAPIQGAPPQKICESNFLWFAAAQHYFWKLLY